MLPHRTFTTFTSPKLNVLVIPILSTLWTYRLLCICIATFAALVKESSLKISSITHSHSILSLDTAQQKYAPVEFADNPTIDKTKNFKSVLPPFKNVF